jgi:hypothetical protein
MNPHPPPPVQWTPPPAEPSRQGSSGRIAIALVVVGLIAVAALVVGIIDLTRPTSSGASVASTSTTPATPTFTPDQVASAKKDLCSTYQVAARSVDADTNSSDKAIARISLANAAGMINSAAANPALNANDRDAARALASAYWVTNAVSSVTDAASPLYQTTLDDAKRAADAMAAVCR